MKTDNDTPTSKQTWALFLTTGIDCRNCGLTKDYAGELIVKAQTDPKKVYEILLEKGGILKCEQNLKYALNRLEKKGMAFNLKKKKMLTPKIIVNKKGDKKIQLKIRKKIKSLAEEMLPRFQTEQEAFIAIAEELNKSGYRACGEVEWKYKSVYDFYKTHIKSGEKRASISKSINKVSTTEVKNSVSIRKDLLIKYILDSNMEDTSKLKLINLI